MFSLASGRLGRLALLAGIAVIVSAVAIGVLHWSASVPITAENEGQTTQAYSTAAGVDPQHPGPGTRAARVKWLGDAPYATAAMRTEEFERLFRGVWDAYDRQDWPSVAAECDRLLAADGQDRSVEVAAAWFRAEALGAQGKSEEARVAIARCATAAEGGGQEYRSFLGMARYAQLRFDIMAKRRTPAEGASEASRLIREFPDSEGAGFAITLLCRRVQEQEARERALRDLIERYPRQAVGRDALLQLANYRSGAGDDGGAVRCYEQIKAWARQREDWAPFIAAADQRIEEVRKGPRPPPPPSPDASDEEKAAYLFHSIPDVDRESPASALEAYAQAAQAMMEKYPETVAAVRARLALASCKANLAGQRREQRPEQAQPLYSEAVALYEQVSEDPKAQTDPEVKRLAMHALREEGALFANTLKDADEAIRVYELIVQRADSPGGPQALYALERMASVYARSGERERQLSCLQEILANARLPRDAERVRYAALDLPVVYGELTPPRWEVAAACSREMLDLYGDYLNGRPREFLNGVRERAKEMATDLPAEERAVGYLHLWRHGYYASMYHYLVPEIRDRLSRKQFQAKLKAMSEAGVRPKEIGKPEAEYPDDGVAIVAVPVQFEKDEPPRLVSGAIAFRLVHAHSPDELAPVLVWLIEAGPIPE